MTPDLHVEELLKVVLTGWAKKSKFLERADFFVEFKETPFGSNLKILAPVIKYQEDAASPRWLSCPRPYRSDKEVRFKDDE